MGQRHGTGRSSQCGPGCNGVMKDFGMTMCCNKDVDKSCEVLASSATVPLARSGVPQGS